MKVGILTFQNANNFGAVLQAYALQKYLLDNNVDCEFINYNMNASKKNNKKQIKMYKLKNRLLFLKNIKAYVRQNKFKKFRKKYLKINTKEINNDEQLRKDKIKYDVLIVGSDQVWNSKITNNSEVFYLNFTDKAIKIAYAASFGHDKIEENEIKNLKKYINDFYAVSLREKQSIAEVQKYTNIKIQNVTDPVFLLEKKDWQSIMKVYNLPKKYIFVYLMEKVEIINQILSTINKNMEYEIIYFGRGENLQNAKKIENIGPSEFIYIINNAEYIITNSFHGIAFSIILEKNFYAIQHSRYNARIENIIQIISQGQKIIKSETKVKEKMIEGEKAKIEIQQYIQDSKKFIENNIIKLNN